MLDTCLYAHTLARCERPQRTHARSRLTKSPEEDMRKLQMVQYPITSSHIECESGTQITLHAKGRHFDIGTMDDCTHNVPEEDTMRLQIKVEKPGHRQLLPRRFILISSRQMICAAAFVHARRFDMHISHARHPNSHTRAHT